MRNISQTNIFKIRLPLPPLKEQQLIAQELEKQTHAIRKIEEEVEKDLIRADRLRQSILKKAFSGRLVPQNNDELYEPSQMQ